MTEKRISKFGNEKIWKLANEMEATRNAPAKRINFAKGASRTGSRSTTGGASRTGEEN